MILTDSLFGGDTIFFISVYNFESFIFGLWLVVGSGFSSPFTTIGGRLLTPGF